MKRFQQHQEIVSPLEHMVWLCYDCYHSSGTNEVPGTATPASIPARSRNNSTSSQSEQANVKDLLKEAAVSLSENVVTEEAVTEVVKDSHRSEKNESEQLSERQNDESKEDDHKKIEVQATS